MLVGILILILVIIVLSNLTEWAVKTAISHQNRHRRIIDLNDYPYKEHLNLVYSAKTGDGVLYGSLRYPLEEGNRVRYSTFLTGPLTDRWFRVTKVYTINEPFMVALLKQIKE